MSPVYQAVHEIDISAPPEACFAVLTDYPKMPEWQSRIKDVRVLGRDAEGREEVAYEIDVKLRTVSYRLRHTYREPEWIGSEYLGGDFRKFEGDYTLKARGNCTHVRFELRIDPGLKIPESIVKMLNRAVMARSLQDLKKRVETIAAGG